MRLLLVAVVSFTLSYAFECVVTGKKNKSLLKSCTHNNQILYALELEADSFSKLSYDHGYLLADQIEVGSLSEAIGNIDFLLSNASKIERPIYTSILNCLKNKFDYSLTKEFKNGMNGIYAGIKDRKKLQNQKTSGKLVIEIK